MNIETLKPLPLSTAEPEDNSSTETMLNNWDSLLDLWKR